MLAKVSRNVSEYRGVFICWHNKEETEGTVYCDTKRDAQKFVTEFFEEKLISGRDFLCTELIRGYSICIRDGNDMESDQVVIKVMYDE